MKPIRFLLILHVSVLVIAIILLARQRGHPATDKEKILVVHIDGVISEGRSGMDQSIEDIVKTINDGRDDDDVKALVLRINSPGGSVGSVQEIYSALKKFRGKGKFIVSSFGDVAASGGYYLACAGTKIVSQPGTLTGSIGVIMELPNVQGLLGKIGVNVRTFKSGDMKDAGSPFRAMTDPEVAYLNQVIMDAYGQFYTAVKEGRELDDATLKPLADGRVFSGSDAVNKKLVDRVGDLEDAIDVAKDLAHLKNKKPEIVYYREKQGLKRLLDMVSRSPFKDIPLVSSNESAKVMYLFQ